MIYFNGKELTTPGVYSLVISVPPRSGSIDAARLAAGLDQDESPALLLPNGGHLLLPHAGFLLLAA